MTGFYIGSIGFYWVLLVSNGFQGTLLGFYRVSGGFTGFHWFSPGITAFSLVLLGFHSGLEGFFLPNLTYSKWVTSSSTGSHQGLLVGAGIFSGLKPNFLSD